MIKDMVDLNDCCKVFFKSNEDGTKEFDIYLMGAIEETADYTELLNVLFSAKAGDSVHLKINSEGGRVDVALMICDAIKACEANVSAYLSGFAASAATFIFLACDDYFIGEYCTMLIHNMSSGFYGKTNELSDYSEHLKAFSRSVVEAAYEDFLTEEEINDLFDKKSEIYLLRDEINRRLELKIEAKSAKIESEMEKQAVIDEINQKIKDDLHKQYDDISDSVISSYEKDYPDVRVWFTAS